MFSGTIADRLLRPARIFKAVRDRTPLSAPGRAWAPRCEYPRPETAACYPVDAGHSHYARYVRIVALLRSRIAEAFPEGSGIRGQASGRTLRFTLPGDGGENREVWWNVSDAELTQLTSRLRAGERAAYGADSGGFATLITLLEEELETFDAVLGEIVVVDGRRITIEAR